MRGNIPQRRAEVLANPLQPLNRIAADQVFQANIMRHGIGERRALLPRHLVVLPERLKPLAVLLDTLL
jgi:hypothetical protein